MLLLNLTVFTLLINMVRFSEIALAWDSVSFILYMLTQYTFIVLLASKKDKRLFSLLSKLWGITSGRLWGHIFRYYGNPKGDS